jgi:DNA repair photolyase
VFVRWDNLDVDRDRERRLPRLGDDAVVRTFDAPEALDIRFHEIQARSVLNRVPAKSRMPFRWTINPYRGCSHACSYCVAAHTLVLMADGRVKRIADLRIGDQIYGTVRNGNYRRYVRTRVQDHWSTVKTAYLITLEDGTELITSGDHRLLSDRGWSYVGRTGLGPVRRRVLTTEHELLGGPAPSSSREAPDRRRGVTSIEPLGMDLPLYDITTGTGDFFANGVVSHNCFARPTHTYLDLDAGRDFEREIVVKVNAPELARAELSRPSWKREQVALGTNTDPYQWVESRYKLMPEIWRALLDSDTPCSLVTKSPLALRDIDILAELAAGPGVSVYFSVPTLDERTWRETEPHTPSPRARLDAVRKMNDAGIPSGILVAPLIPGVNDSPEQVGEILRIAHDNGAISSSVVPLHLRGEVRDIWFGWLRHYRPDLIPRYEELYRRGAYVPSEERRRIQEMVEGVRPRGGPKRRPRPRIERGTQRPASAAGATHAEPPRQGALF